MKHDRRSGRLAVLVLAGIALAAGAQEKAPATGGTVSYDRQVRPILQAKCFGCHQPAKAKGGYDMTTRAKYMAAGESKLLPIVPGKASASPFLKMMLPGPDGQAEMPKDRPALAAFEIDVVRRWIDQGAHDDTPENAKARFDPSNPPVYSRAPVVSSIDYSPDGSLLAVTGFHEILLHKADGSGLAARLIGLSERIQSVKFSPDGRLLAAAGGLPCRSGEVQVWDVEKKALVLSVPTTFDTIYGISWSPDGKRLAYGAADKTVRAIDAKTGDPVMYQGAHDDWVLDTRFTKDGSHVVSVGRDGTVKLTEVATQRFVDNITSITPGALKGGVTAVARHPERDEIVIGGSDGTPKVYRVHRLVGRVIGDDSNLIRQFPPVQGRLWAAAVSPKGKRFAAAGGLDGKGRVGVYSYEFDTALPDKIKGIMGKVSTSRSAQERDELHKYHTDGATQVSKTEVPTGVVYALAFSPDGGTLAAAGGDGQVRLIDPETGAVRKEFPAAPALGGDAAARVFAPAPAPAPDASAKEALPVGAQVEALEVEPAEIRITSSFESAQVVLTARFKSGERFDATRLAEASAPSFVELAPSGLVTPKADGAGEIVLKAAGRTATLKVSVAGVAAVPKADFVRDVNPVLTRLGCNAGTCHGAAKGKNGFQLSLRGYNALEDVRSLTDDLAARRATPASPDDSLMLLKGTGAAPHEGGALMRPGDVYYRILRTWIAGGVQLDAASPKVTRIEVTPSAPVLERVGQRQQVRVVATYADGRTRDVTRESFLESSNPEVLQAAPRGGLMTALRRGEAAVLARYEGAYAAVSATVMGDRTGFAWEEPESWGRIDELAAAKWKRLKIRPSPLAGDAEFLRRVHLDLTGLPPTAEEVRAFLADPAPVRAKRDAVVDRLLASEAFVEHWTNKWADLLQVNRKFLGSEGAAGFRKWIREQVASNLPYDEFVRRIVTAEGSNKDNPAASYYKILRDPGSISENTTHLFLAVRFNCTKCHDHPFEKWTQDQYYQTAAFFSRVGLKGDPNAAGKTVGGTAVEGAKPLYEVVYEKPDGEITHERTGTVTAPKFPFESKHGAAQEAPRRAQLAAWMTSPDNAYFAKSFANRLWGYLFGTGIIEPVDDIRAGNPPVNPELLEHLTQEFVKGGFDVRRALRMIATSRTYQLSVSTNEWNKDDRTNYSHALARRLPAEVLFDALHAATGSVSKIPGLPAGARAAAIPDSGVELPSGFLATFGRPVRESACECERNSDLRLGAVMALVSGQTIADAVADPKNALAQLAASEPDDAKLVDAVFMRVLNRPARPEEVAAALGTLPAVEGDASRLAAALAKREEEWKELLPKLEKLREGAVARATAELGAYENELAPRREAQEKERTGRIAKVEAELKGIEDGLPAKAEAWLKKQKADADWTPLLVSKAEASNGAALAVQPDLSVLATDKNGKGTYTVTARTSLKGISAVRLEVLADPRLPAGGPGRAADGNFVLTQFELSAAPASDPSKAAKAFFEKAEADFQQKDFAVKAAISGQPDNGKGWAVSPAGGSTHWAVFTLKDPVSLEGGTILTFSLRQTFSGNDYMLGRFRLSVTTAPKEQVALGLSDELRAVAATEPAKRDAAQKAALLKHYRVLDADHLKKSAELAEARKPLPPDPRLVELQGALKEASKPVPLDGRLVQLRSDSAQAAEQAKQRRLTMAQDLAWALINSPAFLFNR